MSARAPASDPVDPAGLLAVAERAARAAAVELRSRAADRGALRIETKSSVTDPVTEADQAAERAIRRVLAADVPDDAIVGEEGDDRPGTTGRRWIVDPLDGTVNFLYGIPQWCVSVACEGLVGVVLDPNRDELFAATIDGPATLDGALLEPRPAPEGGLAHALVVTGFGYAADVRADQGALVARLLPRVRDLRRPGAAALDVVGIAAGRGDVYFEYGVKRWDTAAGEVIARAAGLTVVRLEPWGALSAGILVGPRSLVDQILPLLGPPR